MSKLLSTNNDWTFDKLRAGEEAIAEIAFDELHLDVYPTQIDIISSSQMLELYASHGMAMMYDHWSFGKHFIQEEFTYRKGYSGLAYEIVTNNSPCISYLMEENSFTMQLLVIAHAAYGHNHVFKNNYLFKQWTDAEGIGEYLKFAKNYIAKCEEQHGAKAVEETLDACHAIMNYGVDRYSRPSKLSKQAEQEQQAARAARVQAEANELWSTIPKKTTADAAPDKKTFPAEPQENLMYFIEKHSPTLESWQREIVRIVRKVSQYFYPQRQTQVLNEGWASFTHYYIMNRLWEKGFIDEGSYLEFIHSHAGVLNQLPHSHKHYNGFNPYAIGFDIYTDIRRICTNPTKEDEEYFPHLVGTDWLEACLGAVRDYRDESFISQFLSPHLMRKWGLFEVTNNQSDNFVSVSNIQDARGYNAVRQSLSQQYSAMSRQPDIQIVDANLRGNRELKLQYTPRNGVKLDDNKYAVIKHIEFLWGHNVSLL